MDNLPTMDKQTAHPCPIYCPYISTSEEGPTSEQWTKCLSPKCPLFRGSIVVQSIVSLGGFQPESVCESLRVTPSAVKEPLSLRSSCQTWCLLYTVYTLCDSHPKRCHSTPRDKDEKVITKLDSPYDLVKRSSASYKECAFNEVHTHAKLRHTHN